MLGIASLSLFSLAARLFGHTSQFLFLLVHQGSEQPTRREGVTLQSTPESP